MLYRVTTASLFLWESDITAKSNEVFVQESFHTHKSFCIQFSACDWGCGVAKLKVCDKDVL